MNAGAAVAQSAMRKQQAMRSIASMPTLSDQLALATAANAMLNPALLAATMGASIPISSSMIASQMLLGQPMIIMGTTQGHPMPSLGPIAMAGAGAIRPSMPMNLNLGAVRTPFGELPRYRMITIMSGA